MREAHTAFSRAIESALCNHHRNSDRTQQLCRLKTLIAGKKSITSTEVMYRYNISSPISVTRSKEALVKNDILDNRAGKMSFRDPIYAYWLKTQYFAK